MKTPTRLSNPLPYLAGALAFFFVSLPLSLGLEIDGADASRDRVTADPQVQGHRSDRRMKDEIKRSIADDAALSASAKDVKVYTANGNVILKGYVDSPEEKVRVEAIAHEVGKTALVENDLKIRTQ